MAVFADISVSLDGFVAGPNDGPENGLGDGGEALHEWIYGLEAWRAAHHMEGGERTADGDVLQETIDRTGAAVMGRRMYDFAQPHWGENPPFQGSVFVVTHRLAEIRRAGNTTFVFVTEGVERAVAMATEAAGGKDVAFSGGASVIQQAIRAGVLDELQIHVVPLLLGGGRHLFEDLPPMQLEQTRVISSPTVTHLRYTLSR